MRGLQRVPAAVRALRRLRRQPPRPGAGAGAAGAGAGAAAPSAASSVSTTEPSLTLSPTLTASAFTTPACDDGISIEALSDSTVISDCSALTVSPP